MVYTLTFNPALDYVVNVPDFREGIINRTSGEKILTGGKGLNVSEVLSNLGVENKALGFIAGFTGEVIENIAYKRGIRTDFIKVSQGFSRINVKIKSGEETDINGTGPVIGEEELCKLYEKLDSLDFGDILVLAGSVSGNSTIYGDIMKRYKDLEFVVDATGELLMNAVKEKPFLIKPNIFELEEICNVKFEEDEDIINCAKELQRKGARNVLVSMGPLGAILITEDGTVINSRAPIGKVINTTGAGDSMVAGFIAGYLQTKDYAHALKLGISAGSASSFSKNLATKDEIINVYNSF